MTPSSGIRAPLVALGIDAPDQRQLNSFLADGSLPHLADLCRRGSVAKLTHRKRFRNELCWEILLTGNPTTGFGSNFCRETYAYSHDSLQFKHPLEPFYALGDDFRVCVFDLPAPISERVNGFQLAGWGTELNAITPISRPAGLITDIERRHGRNPLFEDVLSVRAVGGPVSERSYVIPSIYDREQLQRFRACLEMSVQRRTEIVLELFAKEKWDLFLALYPESHTANHLLYHARGTHPLNFPGGQGVHDRVVLQAIDEGIGRIVSALPHDASLLVYSIDDVSINTMDLPSMAMLPELMFRWNFPGSSAIAPGDVGAPVDQPSSHYHRHWKHELWTLVSKQGKSLLETPETQEAAGDPLSWNPANWFRPLWPRMRAFALPSVSDGYIRVNLRGREARGVVEPEDYTIVLAELTQLLEGLTNPRTGAPIVASVEKVRQEPHDTPALAPDMVVCWNSSEPADVMDCPGYGRIGPLPFFRSGGHFPHGAEIENMVIACGPRFRDGIAVSDGALEDLPATILELLGADITPTMTGSSLLGYR